MAACHPYNREKLTEGYRTGVTARRGLKKTRRGPKVQRGPNFKFNFGPRSASDHAQPTHMQCICNPNKIENAQLLILNCKYANIYVRHM
jgi:hypothetical protein